MKSRGRATLSAAVTRPLLRLPAVVFPSQAVSLSRVPGPPITATPAPSFEVSDDLVGRAWRVHDGRLAAFGPGSRIGVELHMLGSSSLDEPVLPGVAHAFGGSRVRLVRCFREASQEDGTEHPLCEVSSMEDEELAPRRQERLEDEAEVARTLLARVQAERGVVLESSVLDLELGGRVICDPRCHPLHPHEAMPPVDATQLSLWLGAHLPLSGRLRAQLLGCACPLRRMQDVVDCLRLLCEPERERGPSYKYKLLTAAAQSAASGGGGGSGEGARASLACTAAVHQLVLRALVPPRLTQRQLRPCVSTPCQNLLNRSQ